MRLAEYRVVSPGFLENLRIPLRSGRAFTASDGISGHGVVIVSETTVRKYFGGRDPLGRALCFGDNNWLEIVGVVGDVKHFGLNREAPAVIYLPFPWECWSGMSLVVRTRNNPAAQSSAVRQSVWGIDPTQPLTAVRTMSEWLDDSVSVPRFSARLLVGVAVTGLALAGVGLYGVLAYTVNQQTRDIGLRVALGATRRQILRWVLLRGARLAGVGLLLGLAGALVVGRLLRSLLYQANSLDLGVLLLATVLLAAVALLASFLPAFRAARLDPITALRQE